PGSGERPGEPLRLAGGPAAGALPSHARGVNGGRGGRGGGPVLGRAFGHFGTLLSGSQAWHVDDFELDAVRVVEEHCVVPRAVPVFLRMALDLGSALGEPGRALVDEPARPRLEGDVVDPDAVAVVVAVALGL